MQLRETGRDILIQLLDLTEKLESDEYSEELDILDGNSIGKHIRHVIEFFELLIEGANTGFINYDKRNHEPIYEQDLSEANRKISTLIEQLKKFKGKEDLVLEVSYAASGREVFRIMSSGERELAYNIEHAIHHMAIIKIVINTLFPNIKLPINFGIAYSTVRFQRQNQ